MNPETLTVLLPVIVPLLIAALKRMAPGTPKWLLPVLAPILGAAAEAVNAVLNNGAPTAGSLAVGAGAGAAGVGVREIVSQAGNRLVAGAKDTVSLICVIGAICGLLVLPGCKTTPEVTAYRAIASLTTTVDAAMNGWGDYVRAGKATPDDQLRVREAYSYYQQSMALAKIAVTTVKSAPDGTTKLDLAVATAEAAGGKLVELVRQFLSPGIQ